MIRYLLTAGVAAWLALATPCAAAAELIFAVTEGITYYQTNREIASRFQPLTELLARALKRPVRIVIASAYDDLRAGLARQEYDLAFVHPAHVSLAAIKAGKYKSVAWTVGYTDYAVSMLMNKDQPFTRLEDLRGRTVVSPDPDSIPRRCCAPCCATRSSAPPTSRSSPPDIRMRCRSMSSTDSPTRELPRPKRWYRRGRKRVARCF